MKVQKIAMYQTEDRKPYTVCEGSITFDGRRTLRNAEDVYDFAVETKVPFRAVETIIAIFCDCKLRPMSYAEVSVGSVKTSLVPVREIAQMALLNSTATNIILVHNHPTGDVTPSNEDLLATSKLQRALSLLEIELIDHLVVGDKTYASIRSIEPGIWTML